MKLHLPITLLKALWIGFGAAVATLGTSNTYASGLHSQVGMVTYTDFGQNMGRYRVNGVNDLLSGIRERDGGVSIYYQEGHDDFLLPHYMISYESQGDNGAYAAVGYNMIATVAHNGCQNPTFTSRYINGSDSLHYNGVEYRNNIVFCMQPGNVVFSSNWAFDFKMTRLNKLITDVTTSDLVPAFPADYDYSQLHGIMEYRAGSGTMTMRHLDRRIEGLTGAYVYVTGAVQKITTGGTTNQQWACFTAGGNLNPSASGINADNPLPFVGAAGDSGSPVWIWDEASESYLYLAAYQSGSDWFGQARGSVNFAWDCLTKFDKLIDMEPGTSQTVHIKGVKATAQDETVTDGTRSTRLHLGRVEDGSGNLLTDYVGVKADNNDYIHTWLNLADEKNSDNWFAYTNKYYNVGVYDKVQRAMDIEDLYSDSNLVFQASTETGNTVMVDEDTDLGIGYLQFAIKPESGLEHAEFTLQSGGKTDDGRGGQRDYLLNSAGFVVEKGVDLHVQLTNTQWDSDANDYYYREWRKVGDGNLYLEGSGNNEIFLNVGGPGTTYLKETNGYAAYNVYAASGATVVLENADVGQIYRDFTFGYTGATLDFNGAGQMDWRFSADAGASGFNIHSQSEDGIITNSAADTLFTLTYKESGEQEYIGSFVDGADGGALKVVFNGGAGSKLTLHSIHTDLTHRSGSGIEVQSGNVVLSGTNTKHALGSKTGRNAERYFSAEDWHFADTASDVLVKAGATFTLGSHARLTGDVTLETNATLVIKEGVLNTYEYIEGGIRQEDTTTEFYRQFYGLKGNVTTAAGSALEFAYSAGTSAEQLYTGNITGGANVTMSLGGSGATLRLTGTNTFTGTKSLTGGGLIADNGVAALGTAADDAYAWHVAEDAYIAAKEATGEALLAKVKQDSAGVLALTQNQTADLKLGEKGYNGLIIGALKGQDVHYGTVGTVLSTVQNDGKDQWLLGGGGGNLIVDFALQDNDAELVLGNEYTTGSVTLTNEQNLIGSIIFKGQVTLDYTSDAALGGANISLNYTNRLMLLSEEGLARVTENSNGVVLVDNTPDGVFNLTNYGSLYLGASQDTALSAAPTVAAGSAYRFGGIEGTLTVNAVLANSGNQATGLIVDGQTFSGGVLELAKAATITGAVEVRGYDPGLLPPDVQPHGDITLRLRADNALNDTSSVTLKDGGILDIRGTTQTVHNLHTEDGSLVTASAEPGVINIIGDSEVAGVLDLYRVNKQGTGTLVLSGTSLVDMFDVQQGTLRVTAADALSGMVEVHNGGILELPGGSVNAILSLGNGALVRAEGQTASTIGGLVLGDGAEATLGVGTLNLANQATIGSAGSTLNLTGNAGLSLSANENIEMLSTLRVSNSSASKVTVSGGDANDSYTRVFSGINVEAGSTLTIEQTVQETAPIYEIHSLEGSGTLVLSQGSYKDAPSFYKFSGDTGFSGTLKIVAGTGHSGHPYMSHTLIQSDNALANALVQMQGWSSNSGYITLGIDADNTSIKGLETVSNSRSILMAGATAAENVQSQPVSTRRATLTVTGSQNKIFGGLVVGGAEGTANGLSVVMNGSGTQTFNGSTVVFNNVSVQAGRLVLNSSGLSIKEDVTVARGAQLEITGGWNLNEGHALHIVESVSGASATLNNPLTLNGGTIDFSGAALNTDSYALQVSSIGGNRVSVTLSDTGTLQAGVSYLLSNGNWTGITVDGTDSHPYYELTFNRTANGLSVQLTQTSGSYIWNGTSASHDWSGNTFGQHSIAFSGANTAVFTDAAPERNVNITEAVTAGELVFDSSATYTLGGSSTVSASTLVQMGSGTTDLGGRTSISGQATLTDGTLVMHASDSAGSISIDEKATLRLVEFGAQPGSVSGMGTLAVALEDGARVELPSIGSSGIGRLVVESGEAVAGETLNVTSGVWVEESGTLSLSPATLAALGGSKLHLEGSLKIDSASNYTLGTALGGSGEPAGCLVITGGATATVEDATALNLAEVSIESGTMLVKRNGDSVRHLGSLSLAQGAEFSLYGTTQPTEALEFAALKLTGSSATVSNQNNSEAMLFRSLSNLEGETTLKLVKRANSTKITTFEFGGAEPCSSAFSGTLELSSALGGSKRSAALVLSDGDVAANAVVNLASATSGDAILGLGLNADTVNIAGLSSGSTLGSRARVFSGSVAANSDTSDANFNGDGVDRELVITTAEGSDYAYHGAIGQHVGLTIGGHGTQRFIGEAISADLNLVGGITVLDLARYTGHATVEAGAELHFAGARTVVSNLIETDGSIRFTGNNAVLELVDGGNLEFQGFCYRDIDGNESADGNGFALGGSVQLFNRGEHAAIDMGTASIVYQGETLMLGVDGVARFDAGDSHTYFVRDGVVAYDEDFAAKATAQGIETYHLETAPGKSPVELLVQSTAFMESNAGVSGPGTLGIDIPDGVVSVNDKLSADAPVGTLHIHSGTYTSAGEVYAERIMLDGGSTFQLQASQSANITANANADTESQATVALGSHTLSGTLTLTGDTTVTSNGGTLAADVNMDGHLLTTSGDMTINKPALTGRLRVDSGTLTLTGGNYGNLSDITISPGGTIYLTYGNNITNGVHVAMEDGSILSSVAGSGTSRLNVDVLGGTAEIQGCWQGNGLNVAGTISGNGTLKLGHNHANSWTVSATIADGADEGDSLAVTVDSYVTISGRNTYSGGTTLIDRTLTVSNADALGTGGLTVNGGTLVINNGLNVASVGGTGGTIRLDNGSVLTITGNADAAYAGSLVNGANLLMQGTGNQAFTTAASYGNVDVQSGTLSLNASALSGSVSVAEGAELRLSADSPTSLTSFIVNNGSIRFTGNNPVLELAADGPFVVEGMGYRDIDGVETLDGNGFAMRGSVRVVNMGENASIFGNTATVVCQGVEFDLASDGVAWLGQKSTHTYTVRHGKVTYDETFISKAGSIDVAGFILASTEEEPLAELELVENLPQVATVRTTDGGGILRLGEGVALDAAHLQADAGVTLAGAGTYGIALVGNRQAQSLGAHVSLGTDWNGCLCLTGGDSETNITFKDLAAYTTAAGSTAYSTVEFDGASGYLQGGGGNTFASDIVLAADKDNVPALNISNGNSNAVYTFTGKISGCGSIERSATSPGTLSFTFSGNDISAWSGVFENSSGRTTNISYDNNTPATGAERAVIASSVLKSNTGSMTLTYNNASHGLEVQGNIASTNATGTLDMVLSASTQAAFSGGVAGVHNLTVNNGASASFTQAAGFSGTVYVKNGASVQFLAAGDTPAQHSVGTLQFDGGDVFDRNLLVGEGAELTAANIKNTYGMGTLRVEGELDVTTELLFSTGGNGSTLNNIITGGGTINAAALNFANIGTYNVTDLHELNVSGSTTFNTANAVNVSASTLNLNGTVTTNRGSLNLMNGAVLNINGTSGTNTLQNLTTSAASSLTFAQGTSNAISGTGSLAAVIENRGSLTLNGTYSLDGFDISKGATFINGEQPGNGFLTGDLSLQLVTGSGSTQKGDALVLTYRDNQGSFNQDTGCVVFVGSGQTQYDTYYVNEAGTAESLAHAKDASQGSLSTVRLAHGTTLNMDFADGSLDSVEITSAASATLNVTQSGTIASVHGLGAGQTLTVSGTTGKGLTLSANNTMAGTVDVQSGTLKTTAATALGNAHVDVAANSTLELGANLTLAGGMDNAGTVNLTNKALTLNGREGGTTYTMGTLSNGASSDVTLNNHVEATFDKDASVRRLTGNEGATVAVGENATLTLTSTNRNNYSQVGDLNVQGTLRLKGSNGDIRFNGYENGQVFNVDHLDIDGASGTAYMLTAGAVNYTTDIVVKSLSGGGANHTLQVSDCYNGGSQGMVIDFIIGEAQDHADLYTGKIQYGIGTSSAKAGSGMNLVLKDELVASKAVLETTFSGGTSATVTVDTAKAKVRGLSDSSSGKTVNVSGTEAAENRVLEIVGDDNYTYGGKLGANLDVVHSGSGTQSFGGVDGFHGSVDVEAGVLNILNAAAVDVKDVIVGTNATLGVYNGDTATADTEHEGTLTIKDAQSLTVKGAGATLNANLVMESGSTLDVSATGGAGLMLGSTLTLHQGMNLSQADLDAVKLLDIDGTYTLFNGVDALTLGEISYTEIAPAQVDAADYYNNLARGQYFLVYDGSNVGNVAIFSTVPEPATGTLSLLALAALAARRRRK